MNITNLDRWKFRRCLETLNRYGCDNNFKGSEGGDCKRCKFNIIDDMWDILHCEMIISRDISRDDAQQLYNDVSE